MVIYVHDTNLVVAKAVPNAPRSQYHNLATAIDVYLKYLMCRPDAHLANFRSNIQKKMNKEGISVLTHFFPTIKLVLGNKQTTKTQDHNAFQRFVVVIESFFQCMLQEDSPIVFYMGKCGDNDESFGLIQELILRKNTNGIMFIFDVVDNFVDKSLQIMSKLSSTKTIEIHPLTEKEISLFLSQCICPPLSNIDELACILFKKSMGNPFYLKEHLLRCQEQKLITFDEKLHGWSWDVKDIEERLYLSDNVVTNVMHDLEKLDAVTKEFLAFAAILGNRFDTNFICRASNGKYNLAPHILEIPQKLAVIRPVSLVGKKEMTLKGNRRRVSIAVDSLLTRFEFIHSSIREHFLSKLDVEANLPYLISAAKLWSTEYVGVDLSKTLLDKLNHSLDLMKTTEDLDCLFSLNCQMISKHSSASPKELLQTFMSIEEIIARDSNYFWEKRTKEVFDIKIEAAKSYLLHQGNDALDLEEFESEMSRYATCEEDQLQILKIHLKYLLRFDLNEAINYSIHKLTMVSDLVFDTNQIGKLSAEIQELISDKSTQQVMDEIQRTVEPKYVLIQEILSMLAIAHRDKEDILHIIALHVTMTHLVHIGNAQEWLFFVLLINDTINDEILHFPQISIPCRFVSLVDRILYKVTARTIDPRHYDHDAVYFS
jgi:hypothetical protein